MIFSTIEYVDHGGNSCIVLLLLSFSECVLLVNEFLELFMVLFGPWILELTQFSLFFEIFWKMVFVDQALLLLY